MNGGGGKLLVKQWATDYTPNKLEQKKSQFKIFSDPPSSLVKQA